MRIYTWSTILLLTLPLCTCTEQHIVLCLWLILRKREQWNGDPAKYTHCVYLSLCIVVMVEQ